MSYFVCFGCFVACIKGPDWLIGLASMLIFMRGFWVMSGSVSFRGWSWHMLWPFGIMAEDSKVYSSSTVSWPLPAATV